MCYLHWDPKHTLSWILSISTFAQLSLSLHPLVLLSAVLLACPSPFPLPPRIPSASILNRSCSQAVSRQGCQADIAQMAPIAGSTVLLEMSFIERKAEGGGGQR